MFCTSIKERKENMKAFCSKFFSLKGISGESCQLFMNMLYYDIIFILGLVLVTSILLIIENASGANEVIITHISFSLRTLIPFS